MIFNAKNEVDLNDFKEMSPALLILFTHTVLYCHEYGIPLSITSIKSDRDGIESASTTHEEGRAIDISVKGWSTLHIERFVYLTNLHYADIAAISASDYKPRAAVYHEGTAYHIHLQVKNDARINRFVSYK